MQSKLRKASREDWPAIDIVYHAVQRELSNKDAVRVV